MGLISYRGAHVAVEDCVPEGDIGAAYMDLFGPTSVSFAAPIPNSDEHCRLHGIEATTVFERNRERVKPSLQKLVAFLWDHFGLPRDGVIECGSGATGYFWAHLKPDDVKTWLQVEINPQAIAENRRRNPQAAIMEGSYMDIPFREVPLITGLSSYDTAADLPGALRQVAGALRIGGYFLHVQDVRPGLNTVLRFIERTRGELPSVAYLAPNGSGKREVFGLEVDGRAQPTTEIFRQALGEAIGQQPGLELVCNAYTTLIESGLDIPCEQRYFLNGFVQGADNRKVRLTTVIATVARKKF